MRTIECCSLYNSLYPLLGQKKKKVCLTAFGKKAKCYAFFFFFFFFRENSYANAIFFFFFLIKIFSWRIKKIMRYIVIFPFTMKIFPFFLQFLPFLPSKKKKYPSPRRARLFHALQFALKVSASRSQILVQCKRLS